MAIHPTTIPKFCFFLNVGLLAFNLIFGLYLAAIIAVLSGSVCFLAWELKARGH